MCRVCWFKNSYLYFLVFWIKIILFRVSIIMNCFIIHSSLLSGSVVTTAPTTGLYNVDVVGGLTLLICFAMYCDELLSSLFPFDPFFSRYIEHWWFLDHLCMINTWSLSMGHVLFSDHLLSLGDSRFSGVQITETTLPCC